MTIGSASAAYATLAEADGGPVADTKLVLLSLAEAESLRCALHTLHPALKYDAPHISILYSPK